MKIKKKTLIYNNTNNINNNIPTLPIFRSTLPRPRTSWPAFSYYYYYLITIITLFIFLWYLLHYITFIITLLLFTFINITDYTFTWIYY